MMTPAKRWWKKYYRLQRVAKREAMKSLLDMTIYGTGAVFVPNDGSDPRYVPISEIYLEPNESRSELLKQITLTIDE